MKKQSTNSKTFWENDYVLKTAIEREKVDFLVAKYVKENNTIFNTIKNYFFKYFKRV